MRVHLLFGSRRQGSFEDADAIVFESDAYRLGIDDSRILRVCGGYLDASDKSDGDCEADYRPDEHHDDLLCGELQRSI
jgi:hypothetical protein